MRRGTWRELCGKCGFAGGDGGSRKRRGPAGWRVHDWLAVIRRSDCLEDRDKILGDLEVISSLLILDAVGDR